MIAHVGDEVWRIKTVGTVGMLLAFVVAGAYETVAAIRRYHNRTRTPRPPVTQEGTEMYDR